MIIESVRISNYRSILCETLYMENLTALVGRNGSGKSSSLYGLSLFYDPSPRLDPDDFYNGDIAAEVVIAVTFRDLSREALELFSSYTQGGKLTVERVFTWDGTRVSWKYHGAALQHPAFQPVREARNIKDRGASAKATYEGLRAEQEFSSLPAWTTLAALEENLRRWEEEHPEECSRQRDDGQFFGFKEVAQGYLGKFTCFLFIPAVRDASNDGTEGRGSVLTELMDLLVRSAFAVNDELNDFRRQTQERYVELIDPASRTELAALAHSMTGTLRTFVPDSDIQVEVQWLPLAEINIPLPQADIRLTEDGYPCASARTGHGLQRAFIMTILQHLAVAQTIATPDVNLQEQKQSSQDRLLPDFVIAVEEPELYQHPNRQRHMAKILLQLAYGTIPGVAERTQIIYATHSPLFVGTDRIDQVRLFRKEPQESGGPKATKIVSTSLDDVAEALWEACGRRGQRYSADTLLPRLQSIMTPWMSEGFFADVVVLVEGEDDRAAILGMASVMDNDLEGRGFSVIPCGGKASLDRPAVIFQQLHIPVYAIWDGDKNGNKRSSLDANHRLLRIFGRTVSDWPSGVHDRFACFENSLEYTMRSEIGEANYDQWFQESRILFGIPKKADAVKCPAVVSSVLRKALQNNRGCPTLEQVVEKIIALKN